MRFIKYIVPFILLGVAIGLFLDASKFVLYPADSRTGREHGCYTNLELLVDVKSPSWIRRAESTTALSLVLASITFVTFLVARRRKRK